MEESVPPLFGVSYLPPNKAGRALGGRKPQIPQTRTNFRSQGKILTREAANPGPNRLTSEYRGQMLELAATTQPLRGSRIHLPLAAKTKKTSKSSPLLVMGEERMLASAPQQQPSPVAVWQRRHRFAPEIPNALLLRRPRALGVKKSSGTGSRNRTRK